MRAAGTGTDHFPAWLTGAGRIINVNAGRQVCQGGTKFDDGVNIANPQRTCGTSAAAVPACLSVAKTVSAKRWKGEKAPGTRTTENRLALGRPAWHHRTRTRPASFRCSTGLEESIKQGRWHLFFFPQKVEPLLNRAKDKDPKGEKKIERKKERTRPVL